MIDLNNSVTVVTGGAGLIGTVFVDSIIKNGGRCIIADLDEEKSCEIMQKYPKGKVFFHKMDITSKISVENFIKYFIDLNIPISALVNSAYPKTADFGKDFFDVEYETMCKNINLHQAGYFLTSKIFAEYFKKNGAGNIINLASIYGHVAPKFDIYVETTMANGPEYPMIKSAIIQLTKYMAKRLKGMNIRVNCISPGGILDNQPNSFLEKYKSHCSNKGMLDPEDIAGTLLFLLSDLSKYVQGQTIIIDDGFSL